MPYKFKKIVKYIDFFELIQHNYMQKMEIYVNRDDKWIKNKWMRADSMKIIMKYGRISDVHANIIALKIVLKK